MKKELKLSNVRVGESVIIDKIDSDREFKRRLMELGFINGAAVLCVGESPFGDPRAYLVCSAVIVIRNKDGNGIICHKS